MKNMKFSLLAILFLFVLIPALVFSAKAAQGGAVTVYLDSANGADSNTGLTEAAAVKTLEQAYSVLGQQITDSSVQGRIVLLSNYTHTMTAQNQTIVSKDHDFEVVITGKTLTVHYSGTAYLGLRGPTTFENITMNVSGSSNMTIYGNNGGLLKIGENVKTTSTTKFKLSAGPMKSNYNGPMSLEVNSGNWQDLFAGCYMYTLNGSGSLVMNGGSAVNVQTTYNGKHTGDLTITVNGGTITNLYGGARSTGTITGNVTVNLNGGTISTKWDADGVGTFAEGGATLNLGGGSLTIGANIRLEVTGTAAGTTVVTVNGTPAYGTAYVTGAIADDAVLYAQGACTVSGSTTKSFTLTQPVSKNIELKYDDRKALGGLVGYVPVAVTISNQQVTSKKVGTTEADDHVIIYENGNIYAVGIGTATLTVNGTAHNVTVTPATLTMLMITGHSVGAGDGGSIVQSVVCEAGQVYSSHRPYSITSGEGGLGYGAEVRAACKASDGSTVGSDNQQHLDAFTAEGIGTTGEGSALGYQWNQLTGEKVWVLNFAVGGSCLNEWQTGVEGHSSWTKYHYDTAIKAFGYAQTVVKNEIAAGHYTLGHMVAFYHDGVNYSNYPGWTYEKIEQDYLNMWNGYKTALATDMDGDGDTETFEGLGLLPFYNFINEYDDHFDKPAAYYMASSAEYPDIFLASNIYFNWMKEEGLSTFPDITYTTQNGQKLNKPVSVAHSANGGSSADSVFCKADNMHPTQVVHNAVGMNIAESLYSYLNDSHSTTSVTLQDQAHNAITELNMVVGEKQIIVPMIAPKVKGNVTYTVSGPLELTYPLQITATAAGSGTISAVVNGQVLAQITVAVTENAHKHCVCSGQYNDHNCSAEGWIAWGDDAYEQNVLPFLSGNYYLASDITVSKSMLVEPGETIKLCLNGYTINTGKERVVNNQGALVITDCADAWGTMTAQYAGSYSQVFYNYSTGTLDIYAGNFRAEGSSSWGCLGLNNGGIVNIYGGDFKGTEAVVKNNLELRGGTLYLMGGEMNIYGGHIYGGTATNGGNIYAEKGALRIAGGTVSGGNASLGGNVYGSIYTTIEISGGVIEDGVSTNEGGNFYLYTSSTTENGATVSRHSCLTMTAGTIQNGSATRGNQIFATTGGNLSSGNWTIEISGGTISGKDTDNSAIVLRNNAHATITGGTISGGETAIRMERSGTSGAVCKLTVSGNPTIAAADTEIFVDKTKNYGQINVSGLEKTLRIDATDVGEIGTATTDCALAFASVREGYAVGYAGGKLTIVPAVAQSGDRSFASVKHALQWGNFVKLLADVTENVTVSDELYLDLNGFEMTGDVTGTGTLYGMDNTTDKYTTENMGRITGTVSCKVETQFKTNITGQIRRYMAIADENGYTFHRFYLGITHMNLKPGVDGVGYKAVFYGDEQVRQQVTGYGYTLWIGENGKKLSAGKEGTFTSGQVVTARLQNFDVENYGETAIYGAVYLTLADGSTVTSSDYSYTLRSLVETVAANVSNYSETQLSALRTMLEANSDATADWNIDSLRS